jgi:hypothetical protein
MACDTSKLLIVLLTPAIIPLAPAYLAADFACRELDGMDVPISDVRPQRVHESVEVAGGQILCGGSDHTGGRERPRHGAPGTSRRAGLVAPGSQLTMEQGYRIGRPSRVAVYVDDDGVQLRGRCITVRAALCGCEPATCSRTFRRKPHQAQRRGLYIDDR